LRRVLMGAFVRGSVRVTVEERPEEWIEIKAKLDVGGRGQLFDEIMKVDAGGGQGAEIELRAGRYQGALLAAAVTGWRLLDEEGREVPFKRELIGELDLDDALVDKVYREIVARNPTLTRGSAPSGNGR